MDDERKLLEGALAFDPSILAQVYDRYSPEIYGYALRRVCDPDLAEECVAQVFSAFLEALHRGSGPRQHLRAYLYRSAHNWLVDQYRRRQESELDETWLAGPDQNPADLAQARLEGQALKAALKTLTVDQRRVVTLRFLEGLSQNEVAQVLGKPVGAVKALQQRALASLEKKLSPRKAGKMEWVV